MVTTNVVRWPKDSTSHEVASMVVAVAARNPVATHCSESWPTWNSLIIAGKATLTMVAARMVETVPTIVVATIQARRCAAAGMVSVRRGRGGLRRVTGEREH